MLLNSLFTCALHDWKSKFQISRFSRARDNPELALDIRAIADGTNETWVTVYSNVTVL